MAPAQALATLELDRSPGSLTQKENRDICEVNLRCTNNRQDDTFGNEALPNQHQVEEADDLEVGITDCTKTSVKLLHEEDPDATEYSSSFGGTLSGSENGFKLNSSDGEVESQFRTENEPSIVFDGVNGLFSTRKKRLTAHWRRYICPLMWRCKWIELRVKELHSQASKYDQELLAYANEKQLWTREPSLEGPVARPMPLSCETQKKRTMKRRKRRRMEDTVDIPSYMSRHSLFSYYVLTKRAGLNKICKDLDAKHLLPPKQKKRKIPLTAAELAVNEEDTPRPQTKRTKITATEDNPPIRATTKVSTRPKNKSTTDNATDVVEPSKRTRSKGKKIIEEDEGEIDAEENEDTEEEEEELQEETEEDEEEEEEEEETEEHEEEDQGEEAQPEDVQDDELEQGKNDETVAGEKETLGQDKEGKSTKYQEPSKKADSEATQTDNNVVEEDATNNINSSLENPCVQSVGDGATEGQINTQEIFEATEGANFEETDGDNLDKVADHSTTQNDLENATTAQVGIPAIQSPLQPILEEDRHSGADSFSRLMEARKEDDVSSLFPPVPPEISDINFRCLEDLLDNNLGEEKIGDPSYDSLKMSQPSNLDPNTLGLSQQNPPRVEHTADSFSHFPKIPRQLNIFDPSTETETSYSPNSCEYGMFQIEKHAKDFYSQLFQSCQIMKADRDHFKSLLEASEKDHISLQNLYQADTTSLKQQVVDLEKERDALQEKEGTNITSVDALQQENLSLHEKLNQLSAQDAANQKKLTEIELLLHRALLDYDSQVEISQDAWASASELAAKIKQLESSAKSDLEGLRATHEQELASQKADHNKEILSFHARLKRMRQETVDSMDASKELYKTALLRYARTGAFLKGEVDLLNGRPRDKRVPASCPPSEIEALVRYFVSRIVEAQNAAKEKQNACPSGSGAAGPS